MLSILPYHPGIRKAANRSRAIQDHTSVRPSGVWEEPFQFRPLSRQAVQSISLKEGVRRTLPTEENSMTNRIEPFRYKLLHNDHADFVAYQRKSSNGTWRTISRWMIPQPADY